MLADLGTDCGVLEVVDDGVEPAGDEGGELLVEFGVGVPDVVVHVDGCGGFEVGVHVVEDGFHVVGGLLEFPEFLVGGGLVLEGDDDEEPVDGLAAAGRVLEDFLGLLEVEEGVFEVAVEDVVDAGLVVGVEDGDELFYDRGGGYSGGR